MLFLDNRCRSSEADFLGWVMELLESGLERADMLRMKLCCTGFYEVCGSNIADAFLCVYSAVFGGQRNYKQ